MKQKHKEQLKNSRGDYYGDISPILNPKFSRIITLIATGINTPEKITDAGINPATWANIFRPKLITFRLITATRLPSGKVYYVFNWDTFLRLICREMLSNLEESQEKLKNIQTYMERYINDKQNIKGTIAKLQKNNTSSWDREKTEKEIALMKKITPFRRSQTLYSECKKQIDTIIKNKEIVRQLFYDSSVDTINWIICQLYAFFSELEWIRQPIQSKYMNATGEHKGTFKFEQVTEWKCIFEESIDFFKAMSSQYWVSSRISGAYTQYPFNKKEFGKKKFDNAISIYDLTIRFNINWLIAIKPNDSAKLQSYSLDDVE